FFFSSRRRHTRFSRDWSSDVCSSDLLDVHADRASSEIQFGHVQRPTHANTSWDMARFETVAHRWVHVAESGFGVAIGNDSTYGQIGRASCRERVEVSVGAVSLQTQRV